MLYEGLFDMIFDKDSSQEDIFDFIKPSISDLYKGINTTVFSYGQTGSGKTYTIFGSDWTDNLAY